MMAASVVISELNFYEVPISCLCLVCVSDVNIGGLFCKIITSYQNEEVL